MSAVSIIREALADGVKLALASSRAVRASGEEEAVNRWRVLIQEHKAEIIAALKAGAHFSGNARWMLHFAESDPLEVHCNPAATHPEILQRYPNALAAEPVPERARRAPTEAEAADLVALVRAVGEAKQWMPDDVEWAMATALADPDGALVCYRALGVEYGITKSPSAC